MHLQAIHFVSGLTCRLEQRCCKHETFDVKDTEQTQSLHPKNWLFEELTMMFFCNMYKKHACTIGMSDPGRNPTAHVRTVKQPRKETYQNKRKQAAQSCLLGLIVNNTENCPPNAYYIHKLKF